MKSGNVSFDLKRFAGIKRDYTKEEVEKLKGTFDIEYTLCKIQSEKLWNLLNTEPYVNTLGSLSEDLSSAICVFGSIKLLIKFTIFTNYIESNIFVDFTCKYL